jgi:hypothetical protein
MIKQKMTMLYHNMKMVMLIMKVKYSNANRDVDFIAQLRSVQQENRYWNANLMMIKCLFKSCLSMILLSSFLCLQDVEVDSPMPIAAAVVTPVLVYGGWKRR